MNTALMNQLAADAAAIFAWQSQTQVVWNSVSYQAAFSRIASGNEATIDGVWSDDASHVIIPLRSFQTYVGGAWVTGTLPSKGDAITVNGTSYFVSKVTAGDHPLVRIDLQSPDPAK